MEKSEDRFASSQAVPDSAWARTNASYTSAGIRRFRSKSRFIRPTMNFQVSSRASYSPGSASLSSISPSSPDVDSTKLSAKKCVSASMCAACPSFGAFVLISQYNRFVTWSYCCIFVKYCLNSSNNLLIIFSSFLFLIQTTA